MLPACWRRGCPLDDAGCERERGREREDNRRVAEWEEEPTPRERLPSWRNFSVVLSIAAMWSMSKPCRKPNV